MSSRCQAFERISICVTRYCRIAHLCAMPLFPNLIWSTTATGPEIPASHASWNEKREEEKNSRKFQLPKPELPTVSTCKSRAWNLAKRWTLWSFHARGGKVFCAKVRRVDVSLIFHVCTFLSFQLRSRKLDFHVYEKRPRTSEESPNASLEPHTEAINLIKKLSSLFNDSLQCGWRDDGELLSHLILFISGKAELTMFIT